MAHIQKFSRPFKHLLIIFVSSLIAYSNVFPNSFLTGDMPFIDDLISSPVKIIYSTLGQHVFGYHLLAFLCHLTIVFFIYRICVVLTQKETVAFFTSLLWALYPTNVEAVASISSLPVVIGSLFLFMSFYLYLRGKSIGSWIIGLFAMILTPVAWPLPFLILFYEFYSGDVDRLKNRLRLFVPFLGILAIAVAIKLSQPHAEYPDQSFWLNLLVSIKALSHYVVITLFPFVLSYNHVISDGIYSRFPQDFDRFAYLSQTLVDGSVLAAIGLLGLIGFLVQKMAQKNSLLFFGIGWFFISLLPNLPFHSTDIFLAEKFLYVSMFGYVFLLGILFDWMYQHQKRLAIGMLALICIMFIVRVWTRNLDWRNDSALYRSTVETNPQSYLMKEQLVKFYIQEGKPLSALKILDAAPLKDRNEASVYILRSQAYVKMNQYRKSVETLNKAIALNQVSGELYYRLSEIYALWHMNAKAFYYLNKAIVSFKEEGRTQEAERIEEIMTNALLKPPADNEPAK
jgi:hypothetical protein